MTARGCGPFPALVGLAWLLACGTAAAQSKDSLPQFAISFFRSACPDSWAPLLEANGRLMVPLVLNATNGSTVGTPLFSGEDRTHIHSFFASITPASTEFVALACCCNKTLAAQKTYGFNGTANASSTGLPYVQYLTCIKNQAPPSSAPAPPPGLLMFFNLESCPDGWSQPLTTQGRLLVGLPARAVPGLAFGGASLDPQEDRVHRHAFAGSVSNQGKDVALGSGCCAHGYAKSGKDPYNGVTEESSSALPYIQLLQCQKN